MKDEDGLKVVEKREGLLERKRKRGEKERVRE